MFTLIRKKTTFICLIILFNAVVNCKSENTELKHEFENIDNIELVLIGDSLSSLSARFSNGAFLTSDFTDLQNYTLPARHRDDFLKALSTSFRKCFTGSVHLSGDFMNPVGLFIHYFKNGEAVYWILSKNNKKSDKMTLKRVYINGANEFNTNYMTHQCYTSADFFTDVEKLKPYLVERNGSFELVSAGEVPTESKGGKRLLTFMAFLGVTIPGLLFVHYFGLFIFNTFQKTREWPESKKKKKLLYIKIFYFIYIVLGFIVVLQD